MKVVINKCFGGFGLSEKAYNRLSELGVKVEKHVEPVQHAGTQFEYQHVWFECEFDFRYDNRSHPLLVQVVEELGKAANGEHAELAIVEVPDDVKWHVEEYDGSEHIAENHRTWS